MISKTALKKLLRKNKNDRMLPRDGLYKHSYTKFLEILYRFDTLETSHIHTLLHRNASNTSKYLTALKKQGYITNFRIDRKNYWHILPAGIKALKEATGMDLPTPVGTIDPKKLDKPKHGIRHDILATNVAMKFVESRIKVNEYYTRGLTEWIGPILTRTLYDYVTSSGNRYSAYNPDLYLEFVDETLQGILNVELDRSAQSYKIIDKKIRKAYIYLHNSPRYSLSLHTMAFITTQSDHRKWKIVNNAQKYYNKEFGVQPFVVIAATYEDIMNKGPYEEIWATNITSNWQYSLSELIDQSRQTHSNEDIIGSEEWIQQWD